MTPFITNWQDVIDPTCLVELIGMSDRELVNLKYLKVITPLPQEQFIADSHNFGYTPLSNKLFDRQERLTYEGSNFIYI